MTKLTVAVGLLAVLNAVSAWGQTWRNIGPGGGGWLPCMTVSPFDSQVVYAGCDVGGFFKSTDHGRTWRICNRGLRDYYVEVIVPHPKDPKIIFIGTEGGVHRSTDGGESWQLLSDGFPPRERYSFSAPIGAVAIDPRDPRTIYAGIGRPRWDKADAGIIYRSDDGGDHWQRANPGGAGMDPKAIVSDLLVHPTSGAIFAATTHGLYRSADRAATWVRLGHELPVDRIGRIALCAGQPTVMYLTVTSPPGQGPWRGGVYRSDDAGATWKPRSQGLGNRVGEPGQPSQMTSNVDRLVVHPTDPDIVYAGDTAWVTAGVYGTRDGGATWQNLTGGLDRGWISDWGPSVMGLAMDPSKPQTVYFSTSGQIYVTADAGRSWTQAYSRKAAGSATAPAPADGWWSTTGLEVTCVNSIAVAPDDPQRLYLCYFDIGLLQSLDGGASFAKANKGKHYPGNTFCVVFDPANPRIMYAATGEWASSHGDVCRSEDGGWTWKVVGKPQTGLPEGRIYHMVLDPSSPPAARRLFVGVVGSGVYWSQDGGASWQRRDNGLPSKSICSLLQHPRQPATLFALLAADDRGPGGLYRTDNAGESWGKVTDMVWPDPKALVISPADPQRMYIAAREKGRPDGVDPGGVFASTDGGATWTRILDDPFIQALAVDPRDANVIYAGGNDHPFHDDCLGSGVMLSRDGGKKWISLNDDSLSVRKIQSIHLDPHNPDRIYVGTGGNGVFAREVR